MKTRNFFVSNSSSSSFVVVLPNDFKLEQYVDEKVLEYVSTEDVDSLINDFQTQFNASEELPLEIYQYDDGDIFDVFHNLFESKLEKNILSQRDVHSDGDGDITIFKKSQLNKFLGDIQ